ncbi:SDR family NAD(P)-dependent oxidoreductase, partial [Fulvivirga kasyanovii]|nr:SDR family NAD(P)-dependent oxidoreductase [Fulvivirga kasyanovii]
AKNTDRLKQYAEKLVRYVQSNGVSETQLSDTSLHEKIRKYVTSKVAGIMDVNEQEIDVTADFVHYGVETLHLIQIARELEQQFDISVSFDIVLQSKNIQHLVDRFIEHCNKTNNISIAVDNKSENTVDINFESLAYTLQTGREPMESRLAIIAASVEGLKVKLTQWLDNPNKAESSYVGQATASQDMKALLAGKSGTEFVKNVVQNRELEQLAKLWVSGVDIDWQAFYNRPVRKSSVPTYPFDNKKYWVAPNTNTLPLYAKSTGAPRLTALIDSNKSSFDGLCFFKLLKSDDYYINDHKVKGNNLLPGVVYLEMARMAGELASKSERVIGLKNVVWAKPVAVSHQPVELNIHLEKTERDIAFEFSTGDRMENLHAQGKILYGDKSVADHYLDISQLKDQQQGTILHEAFYEIFEQEGFEYGVTFKPIQQVWYSEQEALSRIEIPKQLLGESGDYVLHPSLLEGSLQTAGVLANQKLAGSRKSYIPFQLEILKMYDSSLPEQLYVYVKEKTGKGEATKKFDIQLLNDEGLVVLEIFNYTVRLLGGEDAGNDQIVYLRKVWNETSLPTAKIENSNSQKVLLVGGDQALYTTIQQHMPGTDMHWVCEEGVNDHPSSGYWKVDQSDRVNSFKSLADKCLKESKVVDTILWVGNDEGDAFADLFSFCKALSQGTLTHKINMVYAYQRDITKVQADHAAIGAFAKSLQLEQKHIKLKVVEWHEDNNVPEALLNELFAGDFPGEIRYDNGKRLVKELRKFELSNEEETIYRTNGTYLITGGTGGVGSLVAEYLTTNYQATVIVTGRSAHNDKVQHAIDSRIHYYPCDITDRKQVEKLLQFVAQKFENLNGIMHCAGVIKDALMINKTIDEALQVIAPKTSGTILLDELTSHLNLDFFMMFSSISAELGNMGQVDYAYANSFMDYYAQYRTALVTAGKRSGKTLSVNWPLWRDGGMKISAQQEEWMLKSLKMRPLESEEALNVLKVSFNTSESDIMIYPGNPEFLLKTRANTSGTSNTKEVHKVSVKGDREIVKQLQGELLSMVSAISQIDESELSVSVGIQQFGFDSITLTELSNSINSKYGLSTTPALFFEVAEVTVEQLSQHLYNEYTDELGSYYSGTIRDEKPVEEEKVVTESVFSEVSLASIRHSKSIEEQPAKNNRNSSPSTEPVAIIGIQAQLPQSGDVDEFWSHLVNGSNLIEEVPGERWKWQDFYGNPFEGDLTYCKWGGFIRNVDKFDSSFFNISPNESKAMDPQQRLFMQNVWKTIEDAGYKPSDFAGSRMGVFVGVSSSEYAELLAKAGEGSSVHASTSNAHFLIPNRISYFYDFRGPSESIDTACSSSTVAIHNAVKAIQSGSCETAIAGGVNLLLSPYSYLNFSKAGLLSSNDQINTFDERADGYIRGEGVISILLKPLAKAEADKDHIYGVIKGSAVNHSGKGYSLTAPNAEAQANVMIEAYESANVSPDTISYIEAHGTGTAIGDSVEVNAFKSAFKRIYQQQGKTLPDHPQCGIGSVKPNTGHLEAAAGAASLVKLLMAFRHKTIPATANFNTLNPQIRLDKSPFYIVDKTEPWKSDHSAPRRASLHCFGAGGTNAHLVLEEYEQIIHSNEEDTVPLFVFSAKNEQALHDYMNQFLRFLDGVDHINLSDMAYTLMVGRECMESKVAVLADSKPMLMQEITNYLNGENTEAVFTSNTEERISDAEVAHAIEASDWSALAAAWCSGASIDWLSMFTDSKSRVSLPTYAFREVSHWIAGNFDSAAKKEPVTEVSQETMVNHQHEVEIKTAPVESENAVTDEVLHTKPDQAVTNYFKHKFAQMLGIELEVLDENATFQAIGFDSILLTKLKYDIEKELQHPFPLSLFAECHTISALTKGLTEDASLHALVNSILALEEKDGGHSAKPEDVETLTKIEEYIGCLSDDELNELYQRILKGETVSDNGLH